MKRIYSTAAGIFLSLLVVGCTSSKQATFSSAEKATDKLITALRTNDTKALYSLFGPEADELIASGDPVADRKRFADFVAHYDAANHLEMDKHGDVTLIVGKKSWPMPIPIVQTEDGKWYFDTEAGREEILNRRIGENEHGVIEVCRAIVDAQMEFAAMDPDGDGIPEYAARFGSEPGKRNGLFWRAAAGETQSPLGELVAGAVAEGYTNSGEKTGEPQPFHGYCYRMLTAQGPAAEGGAMDFIINGRMIGGFAVIAYPADYGNSGIKSFIVSHKGRIYQKDLGEETREIALSTQAFNPEAGWQLLAPPTTATAAE